MDKVAKVGDVINEMWNYVGREVWDEVSVNGITQRSAIAPRITFKDKVMAAVTKLIADLGVGDPEKITAEELDKVPCRVVMFPEGPGKLTLNGGRELASLGESVSHLSARLGGVKVLTLR